MKQNTIFLSVISGLSEESVQIREIQSILDGLFCVQGKEIAYEWYVRDSSRKIKSVLRAKGMSGIHTNSIGIYGYKKDPNDKNHWIVDDEPPRLFAGFTAWR